MSTADVARGKRELAELHTFIADIDGPPVLVVEGEAGIGKTTPSPAGLEAEAVDFGRSR